MKTFPPPPHARPPPSRSPLPPRPAPPPRPCHDDASSPRTSSAAAERDLSRGRTTDRRAEAVRRNACGGPECRLLDGGHWRAHAGREGVSHAAMPRFLCTAAAVVPTMLLCII
ncbi:hypothetical protein DAI22_01g100608 [Oryza sativa Japonica Group]|nr:hypothetical protein DAI22_01g100608 [Oryza sativa Japonica Group]